MNIRMMFVLGLSALLTSTFAATDCAGKRSDWAKFRQGCIKKLKPAVAGSLQPEEGLFTPKSAEFDECYAQEMELYADFAAEDGACAKYVPEKQQKKFDDIFKACVNRSNMDKCNELLGDKIQDKKVDNVRSADGATLLMLAAKECDLKGFEYLLSVGASINRYDHNGWGVLHYLGAHEYLSEDDPSAKEVNAELAANQLAILQKLIAEGVDVNELAYDGGRAVTQFLHHRAPANVIKALLAAGAKVRVGYRYGAQTRMTPFMSSIYEGDTAGIKIMLESKVDPNKAGLPDLSAWDFVWSTEKSEAEGDQICRMLLKAGLDVNGRLMDKDISIFADVLKAPAPKDIIQTFFKKKVKVNDLVWRGKPWDPMIFAIDQKDVELVKQLLAAGYNTKATNAELNDGTKINALETSLVSRTPEITKLLLKARPEVNREIQTKDGVSYPMCYGAITDNIENLKLLLGAKANPNATCGGMPVLQLAIASANVEAVKILVGAKANVNAKSPNGVAMVEIAESIGNEEIVQILQKAGAIVPFHGNFVAYCANEGLTEKMAAEAIKSGADVNEVNANGWTPLHSAASFVKDPKVLHLLIKNGALVNSQSTVGLTPLIAAARLNPNPAIVKLLISAGADTEAKDPENNNWDALQTAVANNSPEVVAALIGAGLARGYDERQKNLLVRIAVVNNENYKVLIALLKAGYKAEPENSWWGKPLHEALDGAKSIDIIKILLSAGAVVSDETMRLASRLPMETSDQKKYRNQVIDVLTKAKMKKR